MDKLQINLGVVDKGPHIGKAILHACKMAFL
jgi:hypothetical protein